MVKECKIKITRSESDTADTKFVSYNLKGLSITIGQEVWVPAEYYYEVLKKGNLAERTVLIETR